MIETTEGLPAVGGLEQVYNPFDGLRTALAKLNHPSTLDPHDRFHAITQAVNSIGQLMFLFEELWQSSQPQMPPPNSPHG